MKTVSKKKFKFKAGKAYMVHWRDHWSESGWRVALGDELPRSLVCRTLGWCVGVSDEMVVIAASVADCLPEHIPTHENNLRMGIIIENIISCKEIKI